MKVILVMKVICDFDTLQNILMSQGVDHDNPYLLAMNYNLRDVLSLWFSVGFLQLEKITWESPCDMLQKVWSMVIVEWQSLCRL